MLTTLKLENVFRRALQNGGEFAEAFYEHTTANQLFSPSDSEVAAAAALVQAFEAAVAAGHGAATHDGRMIDAASLRMARTILDRAGDRPLASKG